MNKIILLLLSFLSCPVFAQNFIAVDNYGNNRRKIYAGDQISFKMKGIDAFYHDEVHAITDSSFVLYKSMTEVPISEIEVIRFPRSFPKLLTRGFTLIGTGFLVSGAIQRDASNTYAKNVALVQGASFLALSVITVRFWWKRYKIGKNAQVQILDLSIKKVDLQT